jgi:hypothetical protein
MLYVVLYAYVWMKAKLSGRDFHELLAEYGLPENFLELFEPEFTEEELLELEEAEKRSRNNNLTWWKVIKIYVLLWVGVSILIFILDVIGVF